MRGLLHSLQLGTSRTLHDDLNFAVAKDGNTLFTKMTLGNAVQELAPAASHFIT